MLAVNQLSLEFPSRVIFDQISFLINPSEKVALVGRNGAGKSTLLKIIAGEQSPNGGNISRPKDFSIGYLPQILPLPTGRTVREEAERAFAELRALEEKIDYINGQFQIRSDYESDSYMKLIEDLHEYTTRYEALGGYNSAGEVEKVLFGLGFKPQDLDKDLSEFSGGWRMRVELAKILLMNHDLMLLDEPTNHLDIESILWLESFLKEHPAAVLMVSHDRVFMDNITKRTIELVNAKAYDYPASYTRFMELREERRLQQIATRKNQEKEMKETQLLIDKFRAKASKASFAQSLIKKLDKMELTEVDDMETSKIHFRFPPAPRSGKVALRVENLSKSYGEKQVLKNVDLEVERHDRIAFIGQNGQGKTTMMRMIMNELAPTTGKVEIGHNISIGYYAQEQTSALDGDITVLQTIENIAPDEIRPRVRSLLGAFMFGGEDVDKKVKVLSGGEKGRLALCKLLLQPVNLLVMDEPTNHLDLRSKEVLKQALMKFDGTLIVVSHDRDFLQGLTNKAFEFKGGRVKPWLGDIESFLNEKSHQNFREYEVKKKDIPGKETIDKKEEIPAKAIDKEKEKQLKSAQKQLLQIEQEIEHLEAELKRLDEQLANPDTFKELSAQPGFFEDYETKKSQLEKHMQAWETAHQAVEGLS